MIHQAKWSVYPISNAQVVVEVHLALPNGRAIALADLLEPFWSPDLINGHLLDLNTKIMLAAEAVTRVVH